MVKVCFLNIYPVSRFPKSSVDVWELVVEVGMGNLHELSWGSSGSWWSGSWVELWWEIEGLSLLSIGSCGLLSLLGGSWVLSLSSSLSISLDDCFFLSGLLSSLLLDISSDRNILALLEGGNLWINGSISESLLKVLSFSLVDEESVLIVLLGVLDRSSGLNGVLLLVIRVFEFVSHGWSDLGLNKWVEWLLHLSTGNSLSLSDGVEGGSHILIIGVGWWWHSSLLLLESGISIQVANVNLWWTKRAVNWVRLKLGSR